MRFLGGLLKTIAVILLLAATAGCTAVVVLYGDTDVYWTMGILWTVALLLTLIIWGNGQALTQVHKLKKRVEHLEHRLERAPVQTAAADPDFPEINTAVRTTAKRTGGAYAAPKSSSGKWIWILVILVLVIALAATGLLLYSRKNIAVSVPQATAAPEVIYLPQEPVILETEAPAEEAPAATATEISLGESASTDFVDIRFQDLVVKKDIKLSVTTGVVTRTTGPNPLDGQQYVCLSGKIKNKSTAPLPVYDFYLGKFSIDGYTYEVNATDCDILTPDGQTVTKIDPLVEYDFRIYTAIPDALANSYSECNFTFGFFDGFENGELSAIRSFEKEPITHCPYQFSLTVR